MKLFSIEPERRKWTKWVMLGAVVVVALKVALLFWLTSASAGCASAPEPQGWKATFKITVGNQPPMEWEADHANPETHRIVHPSGNSTKR